MVAIGRVIPVSLRKLLRVVIVAVALTMLAGCEVNEARHHVGKWKGRRKVTVPEGADPRVAATLEIVELDVKENGRFTLLNLGIPLEGTVGKQNGKPALWVDSLMMRPIQENPSYQQLFKKPFSLVVTGEDKRTLIDENDPSEPVELIREPK